MFSDLVREESGGRSEGVSRESRRQFIFHRLWLETVSDCPNFPACVNNFPVRGHREYDATTAETLGNFGPHSLRGV